MKGRCEHSNDISGTTAAVRAFEYLRNYKLFNKDYPMCNCLRKDVKVEDSP